MQVENQKTGAGAGAVALALERSIPILVVVLVLTQILDFQSTLIATPDKHEANKIINWLSAQIGFFPALLAIKAASILIAFQFYRDWKRSGHEYDLEFALCLTVIDIIFCSIVSNNYLS